VVFVGSHSSSGRGGSSGIAATLLLDRAADAA